MIKSIEIGYIFYSYIPIGLCQRRSNFSYICVVNVMLKWKSKTQCNICIFHIFNKLIRIFPERFFHEKFIETLGTLSNNSEFRWQFSTNVANIANDSGNLQKISTNSVNWVNRTFLNRFFSRAKIHLSWNTTWMDLCSTVSLSINSFTWIESNHSVWFSYSVISFFFLNHLIRVVLWNS